MKFLAAVLALAATALAFPSVDKRGDEECKFGTYRCTTPPTGIEICNVTSQWQLVGPCPDGTECSYLPQNGFELPFCTNKPKAQDKRAVLDDRNNRPGLSPGEPCPEPGRYDCFGAYAIQVCDVTNIMRFVGDCPERSHCEYLNGIPYCVANDRY